jgi:translation initiation factor IF-1
MGADSPLEERGQGPEARGQVAEVLELLPAAAYRLKLENEDIVMAHATGASAANFVRLRVGDRVRVELAPQDPTRGRIVALL